MTTLLHSAFPTMRNDMTVAMAHIRATGKMPAGTGLPRDVAVDVEMCFVLHLLDDKRTVHADELIDSLIYSDDPSLDLPPCYSAWLWLARMCVLIDEANQRLALSAAENGLTLLAAVTGKRDTDQLALLAAYVFNLAECHAAMGDNARAAKELARAQRLYERLARKNEQRFAAMLLMAVDRTTTIVNSRSKQMSILAYYDEVAQRCAARVETGTAGDRETLNNLIDSLQHEGEIQLSVGNYRDAMKTFSRALRYQKHLDTGAARLNDLSLGLAAAMFHITGRREAAQQLLDSLHAVADKRGDHATLKRIDDLLASKDSTTSIMATLKALF